MRNFSGVLVAGTLALAISGAAGAAQLTWDGTLKLRLGSLPTVIRTGTGVATVNGSSGTGHLTTLRLAGGITITPTTVINVTDDLNPSIVTVMGTGRLGTGTLGPISGGGPLVQNTMPVPGNFKVCLLLLGCSAWLDVPMYSQTGNVGIGVGGSITINGFGAGFRLSIENAPWTIQTAAITSVYTENAMIPPASRGLTTTSDVGFAHGPASGTSTANVSGVIQIVTPSRITTNLQVPNNIIGVPIALTFHFVPEPGVLLLLASGVGGLALLGRHRMRR